MNDVLTKEPLEILYPWHVALVTDQIDDCVRRMWTDLGVGPWQYVTFELPNVAVNGVTTELRVSAAITQVGFLTLGYDQPLTDPNPYSATLRSRGGGAHHFAFAVSDQPAARARMASLGYRTILAADGIGPEREGSAGYFDTVEDLGTVIELSRVPAQMPPMGRVFPGAEAERTGRTKVRDTAAVVIAVRDVDRVAAAYRRVLGLGSWTIREHTVAGDYRGRRVSIVTKRAVARWAHYTMVLEQPVSGTGPVGDFLDAYGPGIHRIAFVVDDLSVAADELGGRGYQSLFHAAPDAGSGESIYLAADRTLGTMVELTASPGTPTAR
jgi:catechol 2,3-dioxygenase-like lactoylglutathione lyase family enzyme